MKKRLLGLAMAVLMTFAFVIHANGEEAKPETTPEAKAEAKPEAKAALSPEDIKNVLKAVKDNLGLSIYLQGGYTFNFRNPDSGTNEQRIFDKDANTFLIDLAQIQFAKDAPVGGLGYKLKVSFGETAKFIHSAGLGKADDVVDLTEAYINYVAPLGSGLKLQFGKFATYHGAEVIEARDDFNYSRSFLFNYAIPFTHTGFMAGYTFSKAFTANLYVVNGWDVTNDNNKGKTLGASFVVTPIEPFSMNFGFMYGPEQPDNSSNYRFLFDWVGMLKATKNLTFVVNTDYAHEDKDPLNSGKNSKWYGVAGYVKYDFTDFFSTSIRAEYFNDKDGVRTGIAQKLKEITITPEFKIAKNLLVRPEYRHDWSDKNGFDSQHNTLDKKSQDTIAIGMMYTW
ncbi:MAG: porin [Thermodesulfobacteriota bacterium]